MKKKILLYGLLFLVTVLLTIPFMGKYKVNPQVKEIKKTSMDISEVAQPIGITPEMLLIRMNKEIKSIPYNFNDMQQKQQWFLAYKDIIAKYPKVLHKKTIYETYSEKEIELLFRIVQAEVGDEYDFDEKANVASVIFNRLHSDKYKSLTHVLTAEGQFSPYRSGKYLKVVIDEKTILACEYVFLFGDTTGGCYSFMMAKQEKWHGWTWQFNDDCHHFYK